MVFFPIFVILFLSAASLAFPRGIRLPETIGTDPLEKQEDEHSQLSPANRAEEAQLLETAEMLPLRWDILPRTSPQVEELFEYLQMGDLTLGLENLFLRVNPGENGKAQYVRSEPIADIEEDGNFTVTPPERPVSTPPFNIG